MSLYFRPEWPTVSVYLPDESDPAEIPLTPSFWEGSPELRSPRIRDFFARNDLLRWQRNRPPHFELIPLGEGVFRVSWIVKPTGQTALPLT